MPMTEALEGERSSMKSEEKLLYLVCLVMALLFLGLAGLNYFSAGSFISTDSLFFTTVAGMMALLFLLVPALSIRANKKAAQAPESSGAPAVSSGKAAKHAAMRAAAVAANMPLLRDAKGRPVPPDVRKMMETMKEPEVKSS
jgi:hypothetical protein